MPAEWDSYRLADIYACTDVPFSIDVQRKGSKLSVRIERNGKTFKTMKVKPGETMQVRR